VISQDTNPAPDRSEPLASNPISQKKAVRRPPRILVSTSTYPFRLEEGLPRFINDLAQALAEHTDVTVLAPHSPGAALKEREKDVRVRRFSYFLPRRLQRLALGQGMRDNLRGSWLARLQVPPYVLAQALSTRREIRRSDIDLVFSHWIVPQGLTAAWAIGARRRVPLAVHVHGGDAYILKELPIGRAIARYVHSRANLVFASGSGVRDCLDEVLGFESGAIIQPMGVDTSVFSNRDTSPDHAAPSPAGTEFEDGFLLFVGRLIEIKGVEYLIRSLPHVLERFPGVGLVIVGDGPERARIEDEIKSLGLERAVRLLGRLPHSEVVRYLHHCRVAVVPSIVDAAGRTEGMPTTVIEAMAAGCRVVGSAVDGIPDIIRHGENGWLCRDKDPADLAEKILAALEDSEGSGMVKAAHATGAAHDWRAVASTYAQHFSELVNSRAKS
jgi:glycosyltransferase involved in cell wall biosynthesis